MMVSNHINKKAHWSSYIFYEYRGPNISKLRVNGLERSLQIYTTMSCEKENTLVLYPAESYSRMKNNS